MDSFYDVPRQAPVPTPVEKFLAAPVVPEVSMICPPKSAATNCMPYHAWKMQQNPSGNVNILTSNSQNVMKGLAVHRFSSPQNNSQLFKKQVRFESPVLQQRPSLTYEPFNTRRVSEPNDNNPKVCENYAAVNKQKEPPLNGRTFGEIYMANVPTRQLDLSIIELPKNGKKCNEKEVHLVNIQHELDKDKENELPKTYREFLETQKKVGKQSEVDANDSVTDIFNYKKNKNFNTSERLEGKETFDGQFMNKLDLSAKPLRKINCSPTEKSPKCGIDTNTRNICTQNLVREIEAEKPQIPLNINSSYTPLPTWKYREDDTYQSHLRALKSHFPKSDTETQTSIAYRSPIQTDSKEKLPEDDSGPTNKDLLKIIAQQNEQLLILQKQVAMLLNRDQTSQPKQIEGGYGAQCSPKGRYVGENCTTSTQNENFRMPHQDTSSPRKRGMSKFSIDLMTSFEVAIRPQHKQNFANYEPKIQEVTESESVATGTTDRNERTVVDTSLHLQEPVKVREICPSPEPSININMNDYDSSEDDEVTASEIGATFYHNLMGQVNNILKKAQVQTKAELASREIEKKIVCPEKAKNTTMSRVKEATLKHLRNIGVTVGPMDDCDDFLNFENDSREYSPTEVSFAVKQILMKYLPDDHLAKITWKKTQSAPINANVEKPGIIPSRPEFSFASVQYMKKYNLLPNTDPRPKELGQIPKTAPVERVAGPKILDITALKMQPKLL